jgi:hypothetical protein
MYTKKEKKEGLTSLIEMQTPDWLTKQVYQEYLDAFNYHKKNLSNPSNFKANIEELIGKQLSVDPNVQWGYLDVNVTAKFFVNLWREGRLISPPSTGQDPKQYTKANEETASTHAGNMWGDDNGSFWLREGVLNFVIYPNGKTVLEATDIEHRLWGIIAAALGYVPFKSNRKLYFESPKIKKLNEDGSISNSIQINGMTVFDIVEESNKYVENGIVTIDDVLNRYYSVGHTFKLRLLPMYSEKECHNFYEVLNKSDNKKEAQLLHASTYPSNFWIKTLSSIKLDRFKAADYKLHPLFKNLYPNGLLISLESFMTSHMIFQYVINNEYFVESTDVKIRQKIHDTYGYSSDWNGNEIEDIKENIIEKLDILYKFYSQIENPKITRQVIQQILQTLKWIDGENYIVCDWNLFAKSLYEFIQTERVHHEGDDKGTKTKFGTNLGAAKLKDYKSAFAYIKKGFLQEHIIKNEDSLSIGISIKSDSIPRLFSNDVIDDSYKKEKGIDIDGNIINGRRVGGHIISDFELIRMTPDERVQAFIDEGLGDKFDFDLNCRAMSSHHNLRMSVLRLSEYINIMHLPDSAIKEAIKKKKESLSNKPILV